ncbi:MAG: hypothetical protein WKF88_03550 [Ferruginibacter sp.]
MSLDNLKLSPYLLTKMYEHSLINTAENKQPVLPEKASKKKQVGKVDPVSTTSPDQIPFLGNNKRNILITVDEKDHAFLAEADLDFLITVLNACSVTPEDVALVNCHRVPGATYENLISQFSPAIILFMGTEPQLLGFPVQIPRYRIQKYNNQQYVCAPSLQELAANKEEKKQLWGVLKTLFSIP